MSFTPGYSDALTKACCERMPMTRFYLKNARFSGTGNYSTVTGLESMQNWGSMLSGERRRKGVQGKTATGGMLHEYSSFFSVVLHGGFLYDIFVTTQVSYFASA
jgi:hypothetical protein